MALVTEAEAEEDPCAAVERDAAVATRSCVGGAVWLRLEETSPAIADDLRYPLGDNEPMLGAFDVGSSDSRQSTAAR